MAYNILKAYVKTSDLKKETFEKIINKLGCTYSIKEEDGRKYYFFTVERPNYSSMHNGTAAVLDFCGVGDDDVDLVVKQINDDVDNIA